VTLASAPPARQAASGAVSFARPRLGAVAAGCLRRLSPAAVAGSPAVLVLCLAGLATAALAVRALAGGTPGAGFGLAVLVLLALTLGAILVDETLASGNPEPRARAATLRGLRQTTLARVLWGTDREGPSTPLASTDLEPGDLVLVEAGEAIPGDGSVVEGAGWVDESALTPARQPVLRGVGAKGAKEAKGGESGRVLYGTRLLSDWLVVRIEVREDETHLARTIARVEGAERRPTPGEQALAGLAALGFALQALGVA
jgi:potassium-transporting ATPase ATP-binding subunit